MIRKFLPVGQGAFYYEHFGECETSTGKVINVVYDCGSSTDVKIVEQIIIFIRFMIGCTQAVILLIRRL